MISMKPENKDRVLRIIAIIFIIITSTAPYYPTRRLDFQHLSLNLAPGQPTQQPP